jgi:hypothetical protein
LMAGFSGAKTFRRLQGQSRFMQMSDEGIER